MYKKFFPVLLSAFGLAVVASIHTRWLLMASVASIHQTSIVGMFSGAGSGPENEKELAALFAAKPKLYWIGVGSADGVKVSASALRDYCKEKGYPCEYHESDGGHIWKNWRSYLTIFAQKLFK